jgi:hypothetical protein
LQHRSDAACTVIIARGMPRLFLAAALAAAATLAAPSQPCGNATLPLAAGRPNVLLIGDSISMTPVRARGLAECGFFP